MNNARQRFIDNKLKDWKPDCENCHLVLMNIKTQQGECSGCADRYVATMNAGFIYDAIKNYENKLI